MKTEEVSSPGKDGDISPLNRSISNLADEAKASTSATKSTKKAEPSLELLPNFHRVTPAQLAYITFPSEGRYQPVRPVSNKPSSIRSGKGPAPAGSKSATAAIGLASEKYAGGGGILILANLRPEEESEFIEFEPPVESTPAEPPTAPINDHAASALPTGPHIALDESAPEVDPPESFEVCPCFSSPYRSLILLLSPVPI